MTALDRPALARLYAGEHGRLAGRVELERPATYWEENAVAVRRLTRRVLTRWLEPHERQRVLDAGCGTGSLARQLAALGATAVGLDLLPRFAAGAERSSRLSFVIGDLRRPVAAAGAFTALVAQEVLEDHPPEERLGLALALAGWSARRLILASRVHSSWGEWADRLAGSDRRPPVDTVALFRGLHLETPYFLSRRETVRRRNHVMEIAEFTLATAPNRP